MRLVSKSMHPVSGDVPAKGTGGSLASDRVEDLDFDIFCGVDISEAAVVDRRPNTAKVAPAIGTAGLPQIILMPEL